jgi:hypothetical protein
LNTAATVATLAFCCFALCEPVLGQSAGSDSAGYELRGNVVTPQGAAIVRAQVSVVGVDAHTFTNDSGYFLIDRLPRGTRVVEVRALGFAPAYKTLAIGPSLSFHHVEMQRLTVLDSVRIVAANASEHARRADILSERELEAPNIIGGSALNAVALLRPQILRARLPLSFTGVNESATRGQLFARSGDSSTRAPGLPPELAELTTTAGSLSVSVNEGPLGSPDILATIPARRVREMRYLRPLDASARFGSNAASGPVLVIYLK